MTHSVPKGISFSLSGLELAVRRRWARLYFVYVERAQQI